MLTRTRLLVLLCGLTTVAPTVARAQDFGIAESAETINKGNFKIRANPMVLFGKDQDNTVGVAITAGYGFTRNFDMEAQLALYDGMTLFGVNGEVWALKREPFDFSIALGLHGSRGDKSVDSTGIDLAFLPGKHVNSKLDIYGGLDFAFESISDRFGGGSFKTVHLVPGLEYKLNPDLDFVAELGLALNDAARHYVTAGLAYYFR
jgi:hypothetical protein